MRDAIGKGFSSLGGEMVAAGFWGQVFYLFLFIVFINTLLAIFNLIPLPPLDGSHILFTFFPSLEYKMGEIYARMGFVVFIVLFLLLFMLFPFIFQLVFGIFRLIAGI